VFLYLRFLRHVLPPGPLPLIPLPIALLRFTLPSYPSHPPRRTGRSVPRHP
jgi:hypothetical protein